MSRGWRRTPLGSCVRILVGAHELQVEDPETPDAPRRVVPLDPPLRAGDDPVPSLRRALGRLAESDTPARDQPERQARRPDPRPAVVILLPPLARARFVSLPPLSDSEAAQVLVRDAARHFVGVTRGSGVVAVTPHDASAGGRVAALVPTALAEGVLQGVRQHGFAPEALLAVQGGWIAAGVAREAATVEAEVPGDPALYRVEFEERRPVALRRVPPDAAGEPPPSPGPVLVWPLAAGTAAPPLDAWPLRLLPPSLAAQAEARTRRLAGRLALVAAGLLLVAAGVHLWGAHAEVRSVQEERRLLAGAVAPALELRDSLDRMEERLLTLQALGQTTPRWSFALVELSMTLPPETHLTALRAAGDTVVLEGVGGRAGDALAALRGSGSFRDVRLEGSIQRELTSDGGPRERFTLSALLAPGHEEDGS